MIILMHGFLATAGFCRRKCSFAWTQKFHLLICPAEITYNAGKVSTLLCTVVIHNHIEVFSTSRFLCLMVCNGARKVQYYLAGNVCLWSCNFPTPRGQCQLISNFFSTPAHCYNPITLNSSNLPFIIEKKLGGYSHAVSCVWRLCFFCRRKMKQSPASGKKKNVNGYVFHSKWHVSICVSTVVRQQRHAIVQHCRA